jgi:hypothetical protein
MDHGSQKHGVAWRFTKAKALDRRFNVMGFHDLCYLFLFPLAFLVFSLQLQRLPGFFLHLFRVASQRLAMDGLRTHGAGKASSAQGRAMM